MQGRVCTYCGADIGETARDVDHFPPKKRVDGDAGHGGYWWLAYDYENYLLSCTVCNQKCKRDRFPLENGATRTRFEDRERLAQERRLLLNPTLDPVEDWIAVDWQKPACRLVANPALEPELAARVDRVLEMFRLNRRVLQRKKRRDIQRLVIQKVADDKADEVRTLAIRYRPHSLVAKHILQAIAPHVLPTAEEELEWLLEGLKSELLDKLEDLRDPVTATELDENEAKELLWAFALIWKDPPVGLPDIIQKFLERNGLKECVEEYLRLL